MHSRARAISSRPSRSSSFIQRVGAVTDDTVPVARRVAGIASRKLLNGERLMAREIQQTVDRHGTACLIAAQRRLPIQDRSTRERIDLLGLCVRQVMAQVRARDNERIVLLRGALEDGRDFARGSLARDEREKRDLAEQHLQERKLDLETVLESMRLVRLEHVLEAGELALQLAIDPNRAERRCKSLGL